MAVLLPQLPRGDFKFKFISNFIDLQPPGGGETQRINRLGDRFLVETSIKLRGDQGIGLMAVLNANKGLKVRLPVPQTIEIGNPGSSVLVSGASAGTTLSLKGLTPNYPLRSGQFLTVVKGGKRYLHQVVTSVAANGSGAATLTIVPMLRVALATNDVVEIASPTIEGYLDTRENDWSQNGWLQSVAVTVTVREAE